MRILIPACCWAMIILAIAVAGRLGLADRDAVAMLIIVLPAIAFATFLRGGACCRRQQA